MRFRPAIGPAIGLFTAALGCGITAPVARTQSAASARDVTFELTRLTRKGLQLQHGIKNYITLSMTDVATAESIGIDTPPPFPLTATLQYHDVEGAAQKVAFDCDYRC